MLQNVCIYLSDDLNTSFSRAHVVFFERLHSRGFADLLRKIETSSTRINFNKLNLIGRYEDVFLANRV